jgi:hypothetical protein
MMLMQMFAFTVSAAAPAKVYWSKEFPGEIRFTIVPGVTDYIIKLYRNNVKIADGTHSYEDWNETEGMHHYLDMMRKQLVDPLTESFNSHKLTKDDFDMLVLADAVESLPMMAENTFVWDHNGYSFENEKVSEFMRYNENTVSCRISFTHLLHKHGREDYKDVTDITYFAEKIDGEYYIFARYNN